MVETVLEFNLKVSVLGYVHFMQGCFLMLLLYPFIQQPLFDNKLNLLNYSIIIHLCGCP